MAIPKIQDNIQNLIIEAEAEMVTVNPKDKPILKALIRHLSEADLYCYHLGGKPPKRPIRQN